MRSPVFPNPNSGNPSDMAWFHSCISVSDIRWHGHLVFRLRPDLVGFVSFIEVDSTKKLLALALVLPGMNDS